MNTPQNREGMYHQGIRIDRIPVEGKLGLLFTFATIFIFGFGIRAAREFLAVTGMIGILGSAFLLYRHKRHALRFDSLDLHKTKRKIAVPDRDESLMPD